MMPGQTSDLKSSAAPAATITMSRPTFCIAFVAFVWLSLTDVVFTEATDPAGDFDLDIELADEVEGQGLESLRVSHLSEIFKWPGVTEKGKGDAQETDWQTDEVKRYPGRILVRPGEKPISTPIRIPEDGAYRIWLGYLTAVGEKHPVQLALTGKNSSKHIFGAVALSATSAESIEEELPLRFDGGSEKNTFLVDPVVVWEYQDVELKGGLTELKLASRDRRARLDALFISRCRSVNPGGSRVVGQTGTFNRIFYRFRVHAGGGKKALHTIRGNAKYIIAPASTGPYGSPLERVVSAEGVSEIPAEEWSGWLDATKATTTRGSYVNVMLDIRGKAKSPPVEGHLEIECAWFPHPGAVTGRTKVPIENGECSFLGPALWERLPSPPCPPAGAGNGTAFGVRAFNDMQKLRTHREELERQIAQIPENSLRPGVLPRRLKLMTMARLSPAEYDLAIPLLKRTGFNFIYGIRSEAKEEYGLHREDFKPTSTELYYLFVKLMKKYGPLLEDFHVGQTHDGDIDALIHKIDKEKPGYRTLAHWHPMGDEIGPVVTLDSVNSVPSQRKVFHEYLRRVSKGKSEFFGASSFDHLPYLPEPDKNMGRFRRRLAYHCARFKWHVTADFYAKKTAILRTVYPNTRTMANYSPYRVFYYGAGMNRSQNSFALPRANACTGHFGEDWLSPNLAPSLAGVQTESFFASVLQCGVRKHGQPLGMYLIWKLGELDRKLPLLVSHGLKTINLYHWGPRYLGGGSPESSSHRVDTYAELNRAARALGPADEIIAEGRRESARAAILYNRTDEIWNNGSPWVRTDRIYAFLALRHAHIPVDLILEEDLNKDSLKQYSFLYLNGSNIRRVTIPELAGWVKAGGLLYASSGTALRDEYDDPLSSASDLFGATQRHAGVSAGSQEVYQGWLTQLQSIDTISIRESPVTPEIKVPVVAVKTAIEPGAAKPVARFSDGTCAGVTRNLGKGKVVLLGVMPGYLYAHNAPRDAYNHPVNYKADRRSILTRAALSVCQPTATYSNPLVEISRFDHETGIAVIVTDLSYKPGTPGRLTITTDRRIKEVIASLSGKLEWERKGKNIIVELPVPSPVDVVILR